MPSGCPDPVHFLANPPDGITDATQPYPVSATTPCKGVGMTPWQPVTINLGVSGAADLACWSLCETGSNCAEGPNSITSVVEWAAGVYTINLAHGIAAGFVTTIQYNGGQFVRYYHHPANADGSAAANANDITVIIDKINIVMAGGSVPKWEADMDQSGTINANDMTVLIDLLNGAGAYDPWYGTLKPSPAGCP